MSNFRIYPVRGDDPRLVGSQGVAFNPLDYSNKGDAVNNFTLVSGSGSVVYNPAGQSVIGKGSFDFTGTGVWLLNTLFPMAYDSGIKGTVDILIASGSATVNVGYQSFDKDSVAIAIAPVQNNFLINGSPLITNTSYLQFTNSVRGEGAAQGTIPVGTRYIKPRIEITASTGVVSIDALILSHFLDDTVPAGSVFQYAGVTPPQGYLICDGASVLRATYAKLYTAVGNSYGTADGTHFNIPDMRGKFARGVANGTANDPDRLTRTASAAGGNTGDNVGSVQADGFLDHTHSETIYNHLGLNGPFIEGNNGSGGVFSGNTTGGATSGVAGDTRPKNVYFNYIIKY